MLGKEYDNEERMSSIMCPTYFIHGMQDRLIPYRHSEKLLAIQSLNNELSAIKLQENNDHNNFDFEIDIVMPTNDFISRL